MAVRWRHCGLSTRHRQLTLRDYGYGVSASRGVSVYASLSPVTAARGCEQLAHSRYAAAPCLRGRRTGDFFIRSQTLNQLRRRATFKIIVR